MNTCLRLAHVSFTGNSYRSHSFKRSRCLKISRVCEQTTPCTGLRAFVKENISDKERWFYLAGRESELVDSNSVSSEMFCFLLSTLVKKKLMIISFHAFEFLFLFVRDKISLFKCRPIFSKRVHPLLFFIDQGKYEGTAWKRA